MQRQPQSTRFALSEIYIVKMHILCGQTPLNITSVELSKNGKHAKLTLSPITCQNMHKKVFMQKMLDRDLQESCFANERDENCQSLGFTHP